MGILHLTKKRLKNVKQSALSNRKILYPTRQVDTKPQLWFYGLSKKKHYVIKTHVTIEFWNYLKTRFARRVILILWIKSKKDINAAIFKPNATIKLGALFITNWSIHNLEIKELQVILTIPDFSEGIDKTSNVS